MTDTDTLLLVLPIRASQDAGRVYVDKQACNGLRLWLSNFNHVICACLVIDQKPPSDEMPIDEIPNSSRLSFFALPEAYTPLRFARKLSKTSHLLSELIDRSDHLHFAIGGVWGDWASVGAIVASRKKRAFAIWTDRVESHVAAFRAKSKSGISKIYWKLTAALMSWYERKIIEKSSLGMFHGMDCFQWYAQFSKNPHLVHNIHLGVESALTKSELDRRYASYSGILRIVYAGRAHREKGIFDWIDALKIASDAGVKFDAIWYGDGPDRQEALKAARSLSNRVHFPGAIPDHLELISRLKRADVFLFCHKTPESPRCLIEALICGLPILGYSSPYSRDLISKHGGGKLTLEDDPKLLADSLIAFGLEKQKLTIAAMEDGACFDAEAVFRHRSELMRSIYR